MIDHTEPKPTTFVLTFGEPPNDKKVAIKVLPNLRDLRKIQKGAMAVTLAHPPGEPVIATILMVATQLHHKYLVHECVHAAYAVGRSGANPWEGQFEHEEEERIAYPTGEIAAACTKALLDAGYKLKW